MHSLVYKPSGEEIFPVRKDESEPFADVAELLIERNDVLPCCIVGGALTGAISMAIGAKLMAPHGGLFVLLIPGAITPVLGYLVAIIAGTLVAGLAYGDVADIRHGVLYQCI